MKRTLILLIVILLPELSSAKPLDEVRGTIITQYQNLLEKEWVEQLHKDNDIFIDYDTILGLIR